MYSGMFIFEVSIFNFGFASQKFRSMLEINEFCIFDNLENNVLPFALISLPFESILVFGSMVRGPNSLQRGSVLRRLFTSSTVYARRSFPTKFLETIMPQFMHTLSPSLDSIQGLSQHSSAELQLFMSSASGLVPRKRSL